MALKAFVESLDSVDEALREHYVERDGGFHLGLEEFGKHYGAVALKTTLNKVNKDKDVLATKVTELEGKVSTLPEDFDVDEWARLKAGDSGKPDEALQAERDKSARAIEALKAKHAKDLADKDVMIGERDGYIDRTLIDGGLKDALLDVGVNPELLDGALASLRGSVKVQKADDGNRSAMVETDMGDVPVGDFVKEWAGAKGKAYLGKPFGPGGEGNNGGGRGGIKTQGGDFGGDKGARTKAIASKFPELAQNG